MIVIFFVWSIFSLCLPVALDDVGICGENSQKRRRMSILILTLCGFPCMLKDLRNQKC